MSVNGKKKQFSCIIDFFGLKFDTLLIEAQLRKDKLKKAIKKVVKILEKKSSTTYKELQSLVGLFFFTAKVVYPGRAFLQWCYTFTLVPLMLFIIDKRIQLSWYRREIFTWPFHSIRVLQKHTYLQQNLHFKRSNKLQFI